MPVKVVGSMIFPRVLSSWVISMFFPSHKTFSITTDVHLFICIYYIIVTYNSLNNSSLCISREIKLQICLQFYILNITTFPFIIYHFISLFLTLQASPAKLRKTFILDFAFINISHSYIIQLNQLYVGTKRKTTFAAHFTNQIFLSK